MKKGRKEADRLRDSEIVMVNSGKNEKKKVIIRKVNNTERKYRCV